MATVYLPTLHAGQVTAYKAKGRFKALRCGRRFGKTVLMAAIACDGAARGESIGFFAPNYKILAETYNEMLDILEPVKRSASKIEGVIHTRSGGRIDFWTLENERAGRSRKYHKALIDEAGFTKPNMLRVWQTAIKPALLDYRGSAIAASTPNGIESDNFFWQICNEPEHGFTQFHAPTHSNPYLPKDELELLKEQNHPLVYQQEYMAEFVDFSGACFFAPEFLLGSDGQPVDYPAHCDMVYAVIDTAVKQGTNHDATAVSYWAYNSMVGTPLICLDWDLVSIDGAMLENWIPNVFRRCEELATQCKARMGSGGAFIEDAQSGSILLQQCANRGLPAQALPSKLTSAGKDGRAINVSGFVYQGKVKFSRYAHEKTTNFKGQTRNHLWSQVVSFRIGDKQAATRSDDAFDTFTYAVAISLGNNKGYG